MRILDLSIERSRNRLDHRVVNSFAWLQEDINPQDCMITIDEAVEKEWLSMAEYISASPLPTILRSPCQFEIPNTVKLMERVRKRLDQAPGVVVLDSMPLDKISEQQAINIFWIIGQIIGRHVAQKWEGTMIYHVRDTGVEYSYGTRGSHTKVELLFHNDNAFGIALPNYVGLLCIRPSLKGGLSRFCSLYSVHNQMLKKYPAELNRLYEPVLWDRQAEHAEGEPIVAKAPVFQYSNNRLWTRANPSLVEKGYEVADVTMDNSTADAIAALREVSEDTSLWFELPIERGHIQYLNNIDIAHYRSEIIDHPDPAKKRHLVRSWHRDTGRVTYDG